jgi:hypothetical protein
MAMLCALRPYISSLLDQKSGIFFEQYHRPGVCIFEIHYLCRAQKCHFGLFYMKFVYTESSQLYFNFFQAGPNTKVGSGTVQKLEMVIDSYGESVSICMRETNRATFLMVSFIVTHKRLPDSPFNNHCQYSSYQCTKWKKSWNPAIIFLMGASWYLIFRGT